MLSLRETMPEFKKLVDRNVKWMLEENQILDEDDPNFGAFRDSAGGTSAPTYFQMAQAMCALLQYHRNEGNQQALDGAIKCGKWFVCSQAKSDAPHIDGQWFTPEYGEGLVMVPDTIETLRGLFDLYEVTRDDSILAAINRAFDSTMLAVVSTNSKWVSGDGIKSRVWIHYDMNRKQYSSCMHRIIDDGIWYRMYKLTGEKRLLEDFKDQCDEQLKYQTKDGGFFETYFSEHHNVIMVAGARWSNYWATMPFFLAYREFGEEKYLDVIRRSCEWLASRQEGDGGFHAWYYANGDVAHDSIDPNSPAASTIIWAEYMKLTGKDDYLDNCIRAVEWILSHDADFLHTRAFAFSTMAYYSLKSFCEGILT